MILPAANHQRLHFVLARDAAEIGPEAWLQLRLDERAAFLGGPHAMHETTDEGVHDFRFFLPCRDWFYFCSCYPPINRRFFCFRPVGTPENSPPFQRWEAMSAKAS